MNNLESMLESGNAEECYMQLNKESAEALSNPLKKNDLTDLSDAMRCFLQSFKNGSSDDFVKKAFFVSKLAYALEPDEDLASNACYFAKNMAYRTKDLKWINKWIEFFEKSGDETKDYFQASKMLENLYEQSNDNNLLVTAVGFEEKAVEKQFESIRGINKIYRRVAKRIQKKSGSFARIRNPYIREKVKKSIDKLTELQKRLSNEKEERGNIYCSNVNLLLNLNHKLYDSVKNVELARRNYELASQAADLVDDKITKGRLYKRAGYYLSIVCNKSKKIMAKEEREKLKQEKEELFEKGNKLLSGL